MPAGARAATLALVLGFPFPASAATYQCVRPDKTVVGAVTTDSNDPDVVCNHDYKSCNLVCTAVAHIVREGREAVWGRSSPDNPATPGTNPDTTARGVIEKELTR